MSKSVLLVDDDQTLAGLTAEYLEAQGISVTCVFNAIEGYQKFLAGAFDMCILDVKMPMKSGFELAQEIRQVDQKIPIVFLTAESEVEKRIEGLMLGADDYLTKPFSFKELFLRIEAIFRRMADSAGGDVKAFEIGAYRFEPSTRMLYHGDARVKLSEIEARLLEAFCRASDRQVTRQYLLTSVWQDDDQLKGDSLNVYISKLRKRLSEDQRIEILNVHGSGYRLVVT